MSMAAWLAPLFVGEWLVVEGGPVKTWLQVTKNFWKSSAVSLQAVQHHGTFTQCKLGAICQLSLRDAHQTCFSPLVRWMSFKRPLVPWCDFHVQKDMENFYPKGRRLIDPHLEGNLMDRGHHEVALLNPDFRGRLSTRSGLLNDIPRTSWPSNRDYLRIESSKSPQVCKACP